MATATTTEKTEDVEKKDKKEKEKKDKKKMEDVEKKEKDDAPKEKDLPKKRFINTNLISLKCLLFVFYAGKILRRCIEQPIRVGMISI